MENKNLPILEVGKRMNETVLSVIGNEKLMGFEKAYQMASAIEKLDELLTPEYMSPIMKLQGTTLGFKTDKDLVKVNGKYEKGEGYPMPVVKRCLIEAVLKGYQPTNNEFNIIGGNMYPTKNGLERKANEWNGLRYSIISTIKSFDQSKGSALIDSMIKWSYNGESNETLVPIPLKIDQWTSVDAAIGKAKRKSLAWLLSNISGEPVVDGDVEDTNCVVIPNSNDSKKIDAQKEYARITDHINNSKTLEQLKQIDKSELLDELQSKLYEEKEKELTKQF